MDWIDVKDNLPGLEENVIVCVDEDGEQWVTHGMMAERVIMERDEQGFFRATNKKQIEWGQEENGFEYWTRLNVIFWMPFPPPPSKTRT